MPSLAELHRAVAATIASKRLGTIVFVRYTLQSEDREAAPKRLAQATAAIRDWVGQKLDRLHASAHPNGGQVALTLQFAEGATALVSYAMGRPRGDGVDLLVFGNHGSLTHDAGHAELSREQTDTALPAAEAGLLALIERAMKSGKPEATGDRP
jgi:hypothetical protein